MNRQKTLRVIAGLLLLAMAASACSAGASLARTATTPVPTPTLYPTYTPYPTFTPDPMPTSVPLAKKGQWVKGHFFSIKVVDVRTATELDGERPIEDLFVVVEVDWRANNLMTWHSFEGIDFELIDDALNQYELTGMILRPNDEENPQGPGEEYDEGTYRSNEVRGNASDTYKLVYDIPATAQSLRLWFQDFPVIDLDLTLP